MGLLLISAIQSVSVVNKTPGKEEYCVKSEKNPSWSGGCYPTRTKAEKRLQQVERMKHMKGKKKKLSLDLVLANCSAILASDVPSFVLMDSFRELLSAYNAE